MREVVSDRLLVITARPGGVIERPTGGDGSSHCVGQLISQMCSGNLTNLSLHKLWCLDLHHSDSLRNIVVGRVAALATSINCLDPCVKAMAACADDAVMNQMLGST